MVRIFACKTCGANPSGTEVIYLPRAIKVFERVAGAADHKVCILSKNGGLYKNENTVSILIAQLALQDSNKKIIKTLEVNSEVLDNIHEEFKTIVHGSGIRIHSFQEARGISGMKGLDNKVGSSILPPWPPTH
jgi:hypothetical protein